MSVHMQCLTTTGAVIGIAALAAGEPVPVFHIPSPMTLHAESAPDVAASMGAARLEINASVLDAVRPGDHVFIYDFPLADDYAVTLQLEAFSAVARDARFVEVVLDRRGRPVEIEHPWPSIHTLKGHVVGDPESRVYLAVSDRMANGRIAVDGTRFVIATSVNDELTLVYDEKNVPPGFFPEAPWTCGVSPSNAAGPVIKDKEPDVAGQNHGCPVVRIALDTDVEYTDWLFGGDKTAAAEYAATLCGDVSAIYFEDIGINLILSYFRAWSAPDPWTCHDTGCQLAEFAEYWNTNMTNVKRGLAHLLCGRNLGGGMAMIGVVCRPVWAGGYAVSADIRGSYPMPLEDRQPDNWDPIVFAHETGHNFGMHHTHELPDPPDNCGNGGCDEAEGATIMSYCHTCPGGIANLVMEFYDDNVDQATDHLESVNCDLWSSGEPPTAVDDIATCEYDGWVDVFILGNDIANDCSDLELIAYDDMGMRGGTVEWVWSPGDPDVDGDEALALRYTAPGNIVGLDVFQYEIKDGHGAVDTGTVFVNILPPPPDDDDGPGIDPGDIIRIFGGVW